jgi:hypothetical protein
MKKIINESGIKDIKNLRNDFDKVVIVFHQDLDGVASALGMKKYFEKYGFNIVGYEVIQYGDKEWSLKKSNPDEKILYCLCDFAHGKPMFQIHLDHHDTQSGAEMTKSTSFKKARSNAQTISQIISPSELFPSSDILLISTVDSADFLNKKITPDEVVNYLYKFDKDKTVSRNKMMLGLVVNKLLLAFKNKPGFLEGLVKDSNPSLISILTNITKWMKSNTKLTPSILQKNADKYAEDMKSYKNLSVEDGVIFQYGGGNMFNPGSFDRYTPFRNNPDADFLIMAWPMGIVQASCNPFKPERELKGVNLKDIGLEALSKWEDQLKERIIPVSTLKWVSESSANIESVGFTFEDFKAIYGDKMVPIGDDSSVESELPSIMSKKFAQLSEKQKNVLDKVGVSAWDIIISNSGGHKCITNVSGLSYLGRAKRPPSGGNRFSEDESSPQVKFIKMLSSHLRSVLINHIKNQNK